jgi:hypothetical protein
LLLAGHPSSPRHFCKPSAINEIHAFGQDHHCLFFFFCPFSNSINTARSGARTGSEYIHQSSQPKSVGGAWTFIKQLLHQNGSNHRGSSENHHTVQSGHQQFRKPPYCSIRTAAVQKTYFTGHHMFFSSRRSALKKIRVGVADILDF